MKSISALVLVFAILETGCYHPVTRINGPSESKEGVKVELVSVDCRLRDDDPDIGYVVDLAMKVAVTNGSDRNVQFHPDRMRLLDSRTRPSYGNKVSISIGKGERRVAQLEFIENDVGRGGRDHLTAGRRRQPMMMQTIRLALRGAHAERSPSNGRGTAITIAPLPHARGVRRAT
jgi:hypothetical protein